MINAYTDGSCIKDAKGGWAFCVIDKEREHPHHQSGTEAQTTNNRMEMKAVAEVLKYLLTKQQQDAIIIVYSDSKYVIEGLNSWSKTWIKNGWKSTTGDVKNKELWQELLDLRSRFSNLEFQWVKGHHTNAWNNLVDELAVDAARNGG